MSSLKLISVSGLVDWSRIWILYHQSFPKDERKPFKILRGLWKRKKSDVWCLKEGNSFLGFASTINSDGMVMIDFFAVCPDQRGKGYGTAALTLLKEQYQHRGIFIEIESVFENVSDHEMRCRRKRFYIENGFEPLHVLADVFGVPMELMSWRCKLDYNAYHDFYRDNYSEFAASNLSPMIYPKEEIK